MASEKHASVHKDETSATIIEDMAKANSNNNAVANVLDIDQRITNMAKECPPFFKNHNLFILYLLMIPGCLVPSVTLGFDGAM